MVKFAPARAIWQVLRKGSGGTSKSTQAFSSNASRSSEGGLQVPDIPVGIDGGNEKGGDGGDHETLIVSSSVGGDHIMSERSSNGIGDRGHHVLTAEDAEKQIDVAIAEEADMQLDYPSDGWEPEDEYEDQALLSDVNSDEENAGEENWQAGFDPQSD